MSISAATAWRCSRRNTRRPTTGISITATWATRSSWDRTGSGKSFLLNFILTHAQQYEPVTFIFDLGGSYENLTSRLGGTTWRMGLRDRQVSINPFSLPPTAEHLHFLCAFVRVLLQSGGQYQLSARDDRDVAEAVESLYALDAVAAAAADAWRTRCRAPWRSISIGGSKAGRTAPCSMPWRTR